MGKRTTNEEFFNIKKDIECMTNLAFDKDLESLKLAMKQRMEMMLKEEEDPRMFGNGAIFNSYGYSSKKGWNYYERFMAGEFTMDDTNWVNPTDKEEKIIE